MRELVVLSGKGGTGKTSLVAALAALARKAVIADCDVDAADLHLVLGPRPISTEEFWGGPVARVLPDRCVGCGCCAAHCRFDAIRLDGPPNGVIQRTYRVDPVACEGCGVCAHVCPGEAVTPSPRVVGQWYIAETRHGPLVHARLLPGGANSGKLVSLVRAEARALAETRRLDLILADGAPGIGCPVIASMARADLVLGVAEPTLSGRHDLGRLVAQARHFKAGVAVCINKADLNGELTESIEVWCREQGIRVLGRVPFDPDFTEAQRAGQSLVEFRDGPTARRIQDLWRDVQGALGVCG